MEICLTSIPEDKFEARFRIYGTIIQFPAARWILKKQFSVYLKGFEKIGIHKLASLGSELGF
jgi:hypothetical protein